VLVLMMMMMMMMMVMMMMMIPYFELSVMDLNCSEWESKHE